MNRKTKALCLVSGLIVAASAANAAKPSLTAQERKAMAEAVARNHQYFKQPRTEAEAQPTLVRLPDGEMSMQVPESLWNRLSVQQDAQGALKLRETEGDQAPADISEGMDNE
jgi:formylglycine-generating enzyme required for sulfatase activity